MIDILVILDRSGSMQSAKSDHEGGLRSFVNDQRDLEGDVRFTFTQFDSENPCELIYDRIPIQQVGEIRLIPRGGTPLLDAIGRAVSHLEAHQAKTPPEMTVAIIITDGQENASEEWTKDRIRARITELEKRNWTFLFLGANIDAFGEAHGMAIPTAGVMNFAQTPRGIRSAYAATASNLMKARGLSASSARPSAIRASLNYTAAQRSAAMGRTQQNATSGATNGTLPRGSDPSTDKEGA